MSQDLRILHRQTREAVTLENQSKKIFGIFHKPLLEELTGAVLIVHGFASHKIGTDRHYVKTAVQLAEAGIACLRIDLRGCGDSEGELSEMSFNDFVSDVLKGLSFLVAQPTVDKDCLGILGSSLGGALAVYAAESFSSVKALVLWAAVASGAQWQKEWQETSALGRRQQVTSQNPLFQEQFFAMRADYLSSKLDKSAILSIHGRDDSVIPIAHQEAYRQHRQSCTAVSHFLSYPKTGHTLAHSLDFPEILQETIQWFRTHLTQKYKCT
jgi:uncharacterized protein